MENSLGFTEPINDCRVACGNIFHLSFDEMIIDWVTKDISHLLTDNCPLISKYTTDQTTKKGRIAFDKFESILTSCYDLTRKFILVGI